VSSPNAKTGYDTLSKMLIWLHHRTSHGHRVQQLVKALAPRIPTGARALDIGCGDMTLVSGLAQACQMRGCVAADIWPLQVTPPQGCEYVQIEPGLPFPWADKEFDVVLLVDTLHHAADPAHLLHEASRTGNTVIVKDHFEYGLWSRNLLFMMDFVGNYGYGIPLPKRYFTPETFRDLLSANAPPAKCLLDIGLSLYDHLPLARLLLKPQWHFIAEIVPSGIRKGRRLTLPESRQQQSVPADEQETDCESQKIIRDSAHRDQFPSAIDSL
jgi:SAM-dependent methyltransferase